MKNNKLINFIEKLKTFFDAKGADMSQLSNWLVDDMGATLYRNFHSHNYMFTMDNINYQFSNEFSSDKYALVKVNDDMTEKRLWARFY